MAKDRDARITARIPSDLKEEFYELLEKNEDTASRVFRVCVREYIKKHSKHNKQ